MPRKSWNDAEIVEAEIERLKNSDDVKLAKRYQNIIYRRKHYMWNLQWMERRGKELAAMGCTPDNMEQILFGESTDIEFAGGVND